MPSPFDCYLANRGLKTLHVRMQTHERNAFAVARFLQSSPHVEEVIYPGLPSHPQHAIACKQQMGFGGMISFRMKGDLAAATRFFNHVKVFVLAESLGGIESLCEIPAVMTHLALRPEERAALGITDTLVRLSCGIEDAADLVEVRAAYLCTTPARLDSPAYALAGPAPGTGQGSERLNLRMWRASSFTPTIKESASTVHACSHPFPLARSGSGSQSASGQPINSMRANSVCSVTLRQWQVVTRPQPRNHAADIEGGLSGQHFAWAMVEYKTGRCTSCATARLFLPRRCARAAVSE